MFKSFQDFHQKEKNRFDGEKVVHALKILSGEEVNESMVRKLFGATTGVVLGKKVMTVILKSLHIKEGPLYNVLTSKVVLARVGYELGKSSPIKILECSHLIKVNMVNVTK